MRHLALPLTLALLAAGCAASPPMAKLGVVPYQAKVQQVQAMTRTFSLTANQPLGQVAKSLGDLGQVLQRAFALGGLFGAKAPYVLAGLDDVRLGVDDQTHELTSVGTAEAELAFKWSKADAARHVEVSILRAKDGTTGTLGLDLTGSWVPQGLAAAAFPGLSDAKATPAFQVFGGQLPLSLTDVKLTANVKPRGDEALAIQLEARLDQPATGYMGLKLPAHWTATAKLPHLSLDWESQTTYPGGKGTLAGSGHLTTDGADGQQFTYDLSLDEAGKGGKLSLTNLGAKVRLDLALSATPTGDLVSTEDGAHLGKVAFDPAHPRQAAVTLDDGTQLTWELVPEAL
jgi:hypothetical protein